MVLIEWKLVENQGKMEKHCTQKLKNAIALGQLSQTIFTWH